MGGKKLIRFKKRMKKINTKCMTFQTRRANTPHIMIQTKAQNINKNSGFVKEDNSGRSNIFSTGEKALYSYSPSVEKVARSGIGGSQGLIIVVITIVLVGLATFNLGNKGDQNYASKLDLTNLKNLTEIAIRLN